MDIEERAEKWVNKYLAEHPNHFIYDHNRLDMIQAYLAGSAQTQADYLAWAREKGWIG